DVSIPQPIEVAAYFVASEGLANASKHAEASRIELSLAQIDGRLLLAIRDDGVGGADPASGSGLVGLTDRVEALGGSLDIESRSGAGTQITVRLPLELESVGREDEEDEGGSHTHESGRVDQLQRHHSDDDRGVDALGLQRGECRHREQRQ